MRETPPGYATILDPAMKTTVFSPDLGICPIVSMTVSKSFDCTNLYGQITLANRKKENSERKLNKHRAVIKGLSEW